MRHGASTGSAMFAVFVVARVSLRPGFEELAGLFGLFQRIALTIGWAWLTLLAVYMWHTAAGHAPQHAAPRRQVP